MKKLFLVTLISLAAMGLLMADSMYGAFRVSTRPSGADVTLYEPDLYLAQTPTPVYPVVMDEYMELREGIPGRAILLMITKKGYKPLEREIFVPFTYEEEEWALEDPSEFIFELERDVDNTYWRVCVYYGYPYRYPRPHYHTHYHPWIPHHSYHHPGWSHHYTPSQPPKPSTTYPGDIVSGTGSQGSGSGLGTASSNKKDKTKSPSPSKVEATPSQPGKHTRPDTITEKPKEKAKPPEKAKPQEKTKSEVKQRPQEKPKPEVKQKTDEKQKPAVKEAPQVKASKPETPKEPEKKKDQPQEKKEEKKSKK